jgi:predicted enzyme related to lactoylglutathione lyase
LPVIEVDDLEAALEAVLAAGGTLAKPIFAFPGGRRFHVLDPGGNEIACTKSDPHEG